MLDRRPSACAFLASYHRFVRKLCVAKSFARDESDLRNGLQTSIPVLIESVKSFDYSKVHDDPEVNASETIASIMPKLYFCVKQSLADIV